MARYHLAIHFIVRWAAVVGKLCLLPPEGDRQQLKVLLNHHHLVLPSLPC